MAALTSRAQLQHVLPDARHVALSRSDLISGPWGNPADIPAQRGSHVHFYVGHHPFLPGMEVRSFLARQAHASASLSFGVVGTGDEHSSRQQLTSAVAHQLGNTALGFRLVWDQFRSPHRTSRVLSFQIGSVTRINRRLRVGLWLENPGFASWGDAPLPVRLSAGMSLEVSDDLSLYTSLRKDLRHPVSCQSGMEYRLKGAVRIRTGFQVYPSEWSAGVGHGYWRLAADYAVQMARHTGLSFHATARYRFGQRKSDT